MKRLFMAALVTSVLSANALAVDAAPATRQGSIMFTSCAKPDYPEAALREKRTGTVKLMFKVKVDGSVAETSLAQSSGHPDLDEAVRVALVKCSFEPTRIDGQRQEDWIPVMYVWTLD